jgi:hypothetical protein
MLQLQLIKDKRQIIHHWGRAYHRVDKTPAREYIRPAFFQYMLGNPSVCLCASANRHGGDAHNKIPTHMEACWTNFPVPPQPKWSTWCRTPRAPSEVCTMASSAISPSMRGVAGPGMENRVNLSTFFPRLQIGNVVDILRLFYVDEKDLPFAVRFVFILGNRKIG